VREFVAESAADRFETLFVIHPDRRLGLSDLLAFVDRLNTRMTEGAISGFQAFEAHPESEFRVGNLYNAAVAVSELPGSQPRSAEEGLGPATGVLVLRRILARDASSRGDASSVTAVWRKSARPPKSYLSISHFI
jgi:hypothetical protein